MTMGLSTTWINCMGPLHREQFMYQQRLDVVVAGRFEPGKLQALAVAGVEDTVGDPGVGVGRQLQDAAEQLDHGHGPGQGVVDAQAPGAAALVGEDRAEEQQQHAAEQVGVADDQRAGSTARRGRRGSP